MSREKDLEKVVREMLLPVEDSPSRLEWLAEYLDKWDEVIEEVTHEEPGHEVQDDLRRWAYELRFALDEPENKRMDYDEARHDAGLI